MTEAPRLMAIRALGADFSPAALATWAARLARAGVDTIQLRDKSACDRDVYESARRVVEALVRHSARARLVVNARADIAWAAGGAGVHLPASGLDTALVRKAFGEKFLIGRSTHSVEEVAEARRAGADYVVFGPVFATPEKLRYGAPLGLEQLERAAAVGIPVVAIGGINEERFSAVGRAGACGAAAIRLFEDPARAAAIVDRAAAEFSSAEARAHG